MDQDIHPQTPPPDNNEPGISDDESPTQSTVDIAQNAFQRDSDGVGVPADTPFAHHTTHHKKKKFSLKNLSKKQKILLAALSALLVGLIGFGVWWFVFKPAPPAPAPAIVEPVEEPKPTVSVMTGLPVEDEVNKRTVTGAMIENSPDARPQAGLVAADVVYEAVAEGGITRFLALFHDDEPKYVGPIRSARPYYLDWVKPFHAGLAHVGGSPLALQLIKNHRVRDLDQFHNPSAYERISSRYAPHNMYSGIDKLNQLEKQKNFTPDNFTSFERKESKGETPPSIKAGQINFALSGPLYNAQFDFSKKENKYLRSQAGRKHLDDKSGKQIQPDVVIALITTKGQDGIYSTYRTRGTGSILVFQDGQVIKGKWSKKTIDTQLQFTTAGGQPLQLNPGKVWITVLGSTSDVKYKP